MLLLHPNRVLNCSLFHMNVSAVPLFVGKFYTPIHKQKTLVTFKVFNNYGVVAEFSSHDTPYQFKMKKWAKTKDGVNDQTSGFDVLANLVFRKFGETSDMFGSKIKKTDPDGTERISIVRSPQDILNIIKCATVEVSVCAEEIITKYRRSLLDYAIHHRELGRLSTYEDYIHLVACHCLVHSEFLAPNVKFPAVDFCSVFREYDHSTVAKIAAGGISSSDDASNFDVHF